MGLRVIWHSNSAFAGSGYGMQTLLTCKRIQKMPEVEQILVSSFYGVEGGIVEYEGLVHIPPFRGDWGNQDFQLHAYHTNSDVIIALMDSWVLRPDVGQLGYNFVPYFPVDHEPLPEGIKEKVALGYMKIAMSQHGYKLCEAAGMSMLRYAPHSVDTKVYKPHNAKQNQEMRKKLGIPQDAFVVGTVAANKGYPARKNWPQYAEALKYFFERHKDAVAYLHTLPTAEHAGVDLATICRAQGIADRVIFPNPYLYSQSFPQKEMSKIYSTFDVFCLPSGGEGFGVPIIEAQACGVPVIVTDFTAMPELKAPGTGALIPIGYRWYTPLYSYQVLPDIPAIVDLLDVAYNMSEIERKRQGKAAREFIVANYDSDYVHEKHWAPIIRELADATARRSIKLPSKVA